MCIEQTLVGLGAKNKNNNIAYLLPVMVDVADDNGEQAEK